MEFRSSMQFPSLTPQISELYGASGGVFRVGEADSYNQDLDELEREERALESMVQELVNRQAAVPIGVKFHREDARASLQPSTVESFESGEIAQDPELSYDHSGSSEEMEEEDDDDMDEEEEEGDQRATIERPRAPQPEEDSFDQDNDSGDESMEMDLPPPSDWN